MIKRLQGKLIKLAIVWTTYGMLYAAYIIYHAIWAILSSQTILYGQLLMDHKTNVIVSLVQYSFKISPVLKFQNEHEFRN